MDKSVIQNETCTSMFVAALLTIDKTGNQPKRPSADDGTEKMWYKQTMKYYSALKRTK